MSTTMRINDFAYKQSAAQMQRWAWINLGASVPPDKFIPSTKPRVVFCDTVTTVAQSVRSACARPLLVPPHRCFELAAEPGDAEGADKTLTRYEQACWIGSTVAASAVGLVAHVVGVTLGIVVGVYRAMLSPPDMAKARAYYAKERDTWQAREDETCAAFIGLMARHRDALPVWLRAAVEAQGHAAPQDAHDSLALLEEEQDRLPEVVRPADANLYLAVATGVLGALKEQQATDSAAEAGDCSRIRDKVRNAAQAVEALDRNFALYHEARSQRSFAERFMTRF